MAMSDHFALQWPYCPDLRYIYTIIHVIIITQLKLYTIFSRSLCTQAGYILWAIIVSERLMITCLRGQSNELCLRLSRSCYWAALCRLFKNITLKTSPRIKHNFYSELKCSQKMFANSNMLCRFDLMNASVISWRVYMILKWFSWTIFYFSWSQTNFPYGIFC